MQRRAAGQLIGRERELRAATAALDAADVRTVALVGGPGSGTTVLLETLTRTARNAGALVLGGSGAATEIDIPFAVLGQMLHPVVGDIDYLDVQHQRILQRLVRSGARSREPATAIALAVLALADLLSRDRQLVFAVDDAHWVDSSTLDTLGFVGRRASGLTTLFAAADAEHITSSEALVVPLGPLDEADAARLADHVTGDLAPGHRAAILDAAGGNPLALVELARSGPFGVGRAPLTDRLRRSVGSRIEQLPEDSRTILLLAALLESGDLADLAVAAEAAGVGVAALDPAGRAGLLHDDGPTIRFTYPVVASVVVDRASAAGRREAHRLLGAALDRDPTRALAHRAAAAVGRDGALAAALEQAALADTGTGAARARAHMLERAAALSADVPARARRLVGAANAARAAGDYEAARSLLSQVPSDAGDSAITLNVQTQLAWDELDRGNVDSALAMLTAALNDAGTLSPREITRPLAVAAVARWLSGNHRHDAVLQRVAAEVQSTFGTLAPPASATGRRAARAPAATALVLMTLAGTDTVTTPHVVSHLLDEAAVHADETGAAEASVTGAGDTRAWELARLADAALITDAIEPARLLARRASEQMRKHGSLGALATALGTRSHAEFSAGDWATSAALAHEVLDITAVTGQPRQAAFARANLAFIAGAQGRIAEAEQLRHNLIAWATPRHHRLIAALAAWAKLVMALADGDTGVAATAAAAICAPPQMDATGEQGGRLLVASACTDAVEAFARTGGLDEAQAVLSWVNARLERWPSPTLGAHAAHARAVLTELTGADDRRIDAAYNDALSHIEDCGPFTSARARLHYGAWLRRARRPRDARIHLSAATDLFEALGATPWAARTAAELRATGEPRANARPTSAPPTPLTTSEPLTAQEHAIVELAAQGLSNPQIAERMFLSPRTVGTHLYHAFPKLGVTSRAQLRAALDRLQPPPGSEQR